MLFPLAVLNNADNGKKETGSMKWAVIAALLPTAAGLILCFAVSHIFALI